MKKKVVSLLLVAAMATGLLAGCGAESTGTSAGGGKKGDDGVTLRFIDISTNPERQAYFEKTFAAFKEETGITVEYEGVPWDNAADKMTVLGAANDLPDVMTMAGQWMGQFTQAGWLMELDEYYEKEMEPVVNVATKISVQNEVDLYDHVYRIPDGLMNSGIFYRKDWVEEIGYEIPTGDDWTWQEYYKLVDALTDPSKNRYGSSFRGGRGAFDRVLEVMVGYYGGYVYDEEGNFLFNSDECIAAFEEFCTMYTDGNAPKDSLSWGFTEMVDNFVGGLTGTLNNNTDVVPTLLQKMDESQWGVLPMPTAADGKVYNGIGSSYAYSIAANTEYPEESMKLISYLSAPENSTEYCQIAGMLPIRNDVGDNEMYGENGPYSGFFVQLDYDNLVAPAGYGAFDYTDMHQDMMHTEIQKYLLGQQSGADVMNHIGEELEARMKKYLADNPGATVEAPRTPKYN